MEALEIINRTIEEHRLILNNIGNVQGKANDVNALTKLNWERTGLATSTIEEFGGKLASLVNALSTLKTSLGRHFMFEEENLPGVLSKTVMESLLVYHRAIRGDIEKLDGFLTDFKIEGMPGKDLLNSKMETVNKVNELSNLIQEHASKEENILRERQKELQEEK